VRVGLFFPGNHDRTRGSGLKLCHERLMLNILRIFLYSKTMIKSSVFLLFTVEDLMTLPIKGVSFSVLGDTFYPGRNT